MPDPGEIDTIDVDPLPVPALPELLALKVMSGRARDDADVVELLKRHRSRMTSLKAAASRRLRTAEARARLGALAPGPERRQPAAGSLRAPGGAGHQRHRSGHSRQIA